MIECSICKTNNEDRSLYCLECGQRLKPKGSLNSDLTTADVLPTFKQDANPSSSKLHSPMLDLGEQPIGRRNKAANNQLNAAESSFNEPSGARSMGISRNGLHSPLLDRRNSFPNPYPDQDLAKNDAPESNNRNSDKSRLHSPVLDGPVSASNNMARSKKNFQVEEQEYESLRSPLLKAKVPLPDLHTESTINPETYKPNTAIEGGQSLRSILSSAASPLVQNAAETTNASEGFLSFTGVSNKKNIDNKEQISTAANNKRPPLSVSQSLLPADRENPNEVPRTFSENKSAFNITFIVPLVFLALGFKVWFLISLGNTLFSSAPFAFDQAGQILVLVVILILVLNRKN